MKKAHQQNLAFQKLIFPTDYNLKLTQSTKLLISIGISLEYPGEEIDAPWGKVLGRSKLIMCFSSPRASRNRAASPFFVV